MRIRTVKPEWLEDELLASASDEARVLSIALILMADDHGRGRASIATLAAGAWRYEMEREGGEMAAETLAKASRAIRELAGIGFVKVYDVARQRYYELPNWLKHQKVDKPGKPRVPAPECEIATSSRDTRETLAPDHDLGPRPKTNDHDPACVREVPRHIARFEAQFAKPPATTPEALGIEDVEALFSELRKAAGGAAYKNRNHRDDTHLAAVADEANEAATSRLGRVEALTAGIRGFLADAKAREAGCPIGWLATDPGRFRATSLMAQPTPAGPVASASEAAANAECASIRAQLEALEGVPGSADRRGQLETALDAARDRLRIARGAQ